MDALINRSRRAPNFKNRTDEATEQAVVDYAVAFPAHGQHRTSNELRKQGVFISGSGVRSVWLLHNLENFKKRLKALEEKVARDGIELTDSQIAALERKASDDEACGEIETAHPGYLGSQDTFYVGNLKGVGRIYQQTFVDTYSKVAHCKLYVTKTPITAADLLNDRVLPFYASQGLPILRTLTDRGTEYCGKVEQHDYQFYLAINDIEHTKKYSFNRKNIVLTWFIFRIPNRPLAGRWPTSPQREPLSRKQGILLHYPIKTIIYCYHHAGKSYNPER